MKIIEAFAHVLTSEGKNAAGLTLTLETYVLSTRRWSKLVSSKTTNDGIWQAKVAQSTTGTSHAPQLRLIETGDPVPRVLAQGGFLSFVASTEALFVDFGQVERLEKNSYPLKSSNRRFSRSKYTVAGQPKKVIVFSPVLTATTFAFNQPAVATTATVAAATSAQPSVSPTTNRVVIDAFDVEILRFKANETKLQSTIIQKDQLLAARVLEINTNNTRIKSLEAQLNKVVEAEKKLKVENQLFVTEAKRKSPIKDIAANIGAEIDAANNKLRSEKQAYQFGRIELDLRGTVSTDGRTMSLINLGDLTKLKNGATSPGVKLELIPEREQTETSTLVKTPNVIGLTETATRRLLQAVGLQLESINKSIGAESKTPVGQSIQQSPKAGNNISRGSTVLVVFTAPNSSSEEKG